MNKFLSSLVIALLALLPQNGLMAQNETTTNDGELHATIGSELVSQYLWRGQDRGGISIQPSAEIGWQGLSFSIQGNAGFQKDDWKEMDLSLLYHRWGFNIGLKDYWQSGIDPEDRYFYYDSKDTGHQLEANLGYTCKWFSLQAYTIFAGNDFKINGDRAYSTFIELSVPFTAAGLDWKVRAGITPFESAGTVEYQTVHGLLNDYTIEIPYYDYGEGFTCNMASLRATKSLKFKGFQVPIFAEVHANPYLQKAYFLVGVGIFTL
ncbi:MAG: hypothetical protein K5764_04510 [Prevotella sp.]|nr:hypothetical protein [Prevotella sp.]